MHQGNYALVGMSKSRKNRTFSDLELSTQLEKHNVEARCGIQVIDLRTGDVVEWVRFDGVVEELFDVGVIEGICRPMLIGIVSDEIKRFISIP